MSTVGPNIFLGRYFDMLHTSAENIRDAKETQHLRSQISSNSSETYSKKRSREQSPKVDRKKEIHYDLIAELKEYIFIKWSGYNKLLGRLRGHKLTPKDIADCKESESNLFDCLERKGIIEVGKYDVLLKVLEEENEPAREIIRTYQAKIEEISRKEEDLKQKPDDQPRSRCSNIEKTMHEKQEQTLARMDGQLSSNTFVQTQAVIKGKQLVDENKILIYTGLAGEGKTENALCVLNLLRKENPNWIYIKLDSLSEWKHVNPNFNLVILLDDCFGKTNANSTVINDNEKWKDIEACIKKGKVRLILYNNCTELENNGTELFMKKNVIDVSTGDFCLTKENKKDILVKHCQSRSIEICESYREENLTLADQTDNNLKISQCTLDTIVETDCPIGFPYICYIFFSHPKYTKQGRKFFRKPLEQLKIDINKLASSNSDNLSKTQYCLMCYMMLKGGDLNLNNLDQNMLDNIITSVGVKMPSEREKKEAIEKLNHRYVVGEYPIFSLKHQTILECVALCFADDNMKLLLQLCSEDFISEFTRPTDYKKRDGEEIIRLDQNDYKHVIERLIKYLQNNFVQLDDLSVINEWWVTHPLLGDKQFVDLLIDEIKSHELCNYVRSLFDERRFTGNLKSACTFGYTYFIDKLYNELHIEFSNDKPVFSLLVASQLGHTETVMWFLNLNIKTDNFIRIMAVAPTDTLTSIINHQSVTLNDVKLALTDDFCCRGIGFHCDNRTVDVLLNRWPDMDLKFLSKLFNACIDFDNDKATSLITLITRISDEIQHCINKVCFKGSFKVLKSIINKMPNIKTNQILNKSFTSACAGGHLEIVDYLLGLNDNDNDKKSIYLSDNDMDITNLHVAAYFGNFEILMKLVAIGVDVNCKSKTKKSVLSYAIEGYGTKSEFHVGTTNNEIINLLCCSFNRKNDSFVYDLECNTNSDYIKVFDYLLSLDCINLNNFDIVLDEHGSTFAHYCALNNEKKIIDLLINKYNTVIFSRTNEGLSSLHIAAFMGYFDVFEVLVKAGLSINDRDKSNTSVLQYAIMGHKYYYTRHEKDIEKTRNVTVDRLQILTYIPQSSNISLEDLDILDHRGMALIHYCVLYNDHRAIEFLHSCYKQSVFSRTKEGLTCLHIAACCDRRKAFKALVKAGLNIKDRDKSDRSMLEYAITGYKFCYTYDKEDNLKEILGANKSRYMENYSKTGNYRQILTYILQSSDVSLEELDSLDNFGFALVHYCTMYCDVQSIQILIERYSKSVFCRTEEGSTCLHIAAFYGNLHLFEVLRIKQMC
ncbi:hypothetical protein KUTeg_009043 [Tegillarca granosa]|uniref:Novel STAND NTPase 3 domain-containing protein n=1 Tax=Tegillarca granosa TaxID=220873 RepID=A0ABQ9F7S2_TEGGR|nr:hypothetical protein KUTeg_009043 [Tegillarca granosa]